MLTYIIKLFNLKIEIKLSQILTSFDAFLAIEPVQMENKKCPQAEL
jgi:hypothetical protein